MKDFPSCFGENGVQIVDFASSTSSSRIAPNLITCVYQCHLCNSPCFITITWTKNLLGQGLSIGIDDSSDQSLCKLEIKLGLFSKRKGFRNLVVDDNFIDIYWDFSCAKFGLGPEPLHGFYLAVLFNQELILILGDMENEVYKKIHVPYAASRAIFIAKKEHIFGTKCYAAKGQFYAKGLTHEIKIECDIEGSNDPSLVIRVDGKAMMQVKRLKWKFRGNQTILVKGMPVEVYWDVYGWLFGNLMSNAVFLFRTSVVSDKMWTSQMICNPTVLSWSGTQIRDAQSKGPGFSLILCAWKNE